MKKQRVTLLSLLLAALVMMCGSLGLFAGEPVESIYGHISHVDGAATVLRQDKTEHEAVVNLPVAPGDEILTAEKGRVELQFDNGTVIRLDKDSRLKVTTVLAPSLTTDWKVTTLHLMRGALCSINQSYEKEMFQVITPNAAVELKQRATAYIHLKDNGDTFLFAERGKFKVMYGEGIDDLRTEDIRGDKGFLVTAEHKIMHNEGKRDIDFMAWNEYVNRNFKDLHYGISKVPKKIYRFNKGLVYWAEKWSSLYGEWIYDDLFGYVWKPADELFSFSARPFFHANFVRVNGQLFIVPQQPWGWIPAHMGTWLWDTKRGWTWVPGDSFNSGFHFDPFWRFSAQYAGFSCYPTLEYWLRSSYGGYDLYYVYRDFGPRVWRSEYQKRYNTFKKDPVTKEVPKGIREIMAKLDKTPVETVKARLGTEMRTATIEMDKIKPLFKSGFPVENNNSNKTPGAAGAATIRVKSDKIIDSGAIVRDITTVPRETEEINPRAFRVKGGGLRSKAIENIRDFNPDTYWAAKNGFKIFYNSKGNEVVCPNLGLSSKSISRAQREALIGRTSPFSGGHSTGGSASGVSASGNDTAVKAAASSAGRVGGGGQGAGPGGGTKKDR